MIYLIAYRLADGKQGLAINDKAFHGSEDLEQMKSVLPNYNGYHVAGNTWSASAMIYWMQYRPCVVQFKSMDDIVPLLLDQKILRSSSMAGYATYTLLKDDAVLDIVYDPKLIDEGVETAKPFWEKG